MPPAIETRHLTRLFGSNAAVGDLNLEVPEGSIFAFLGPNGAGKTTTIKMLMNILAPTSGAASVLGVDSTLLGPAEFARIGYVSENQELPEWMTVRQYLAFCKPLYPTWDDAFCDRLFRQFDLPPNRALKGLSRGMKVKAALLSSLAYRPRLLVLDEPFTGLDPLVRDEFIRGVLELSDQENWTVFVSSHDIDEVERLADWIGVINNGSLQLAESVADLQARFRRVDVVLDQPAELPRGLPSTWLVPETAANTARFVDSGWRETGTEARVREFWPGARDVRAATLSLRDIFLALARTYRLGK